MRRNSTYSQSITKPTGDSEEMKNTAIKAMSAAVLFATVTASHAQSSVTLYGVTDVGLVYASKTANASGDNVGRTFAMVDSGDIPSLFGMRGVEDLGGGMKTEFDLESGVSLANGGFHSSNGNLFGRQAWVAIDTGYGQLKAGVQFSPFFSTLHDLDPRHFSEFASMLVMYADNVSTTGAFNSNAVTYTSPMVGGFQAQAMIALGGEAGNFPAGRQWSASGKYTNGSLMIDAAIYDGNSGGTVQTPVPSTVAFEGRTLGAAYYYGSLTAKASFVNFKVAGGRNNNIYGGGLVYQLTPETALNAAAWYTSDRDATANHSLMTALGVDYRLSTRTSLYAQLGLVDNHGAMDTGLSVAAATLVDGARGTTVGASVGIEQTF